MLLIGDLEFIIAKPLIYAGINVKKYLAYRVGIICLGNDSNVSNCFGYLVVKIIFTGSGGLYVKIVLKIFHCEGDGALGIIIIAALRAAAFFAGKQKKRTAQNHDGSQNIF